MISMIVVIALLIVGVTLAGQDPLWLNLISGACLALAVSIIWGWSHP